MQVLIWSGMKATRGSWRELPPWLSAKVPGMSPLEFLYSYSLLKCNAHWREHIMSYYQPTSERKWLKLPIKAKESEALSEKEHFWCGKLCLNSRETQAKNIRWRKLYLRLKYKQSTQAKLLPFKKTTYKYLSLPEQNYNNPSSMIKEKEKKIRDSRVE